MCIYFIPSVSNCMAMVEGIESLRKVECPGDDPSLWFNQGHSTLPHDLMRYSKPH